MKCSAEPGVSAIKPDDFNALIDSLCVGRKLDIFSREAQPGCEQFGNEPGKSEGAA